MSGQPFSLPADIKAKRTIRIGRDGTPSTLVLAGTGLASLVAALRKKRSE